MISAADFWVVDAVGPYQGPDTEFTESLDRERLKALTTAPDPAHLDLDVCLALMDLFEDDLELSGTGGGERLSVDDVRLVVRALERTTTRAGHPFTLPFRDHSSWRSYWIMKGASGGGGWQARRDLLSDLFDEAYAQLMAAQDRALESTLADAVSPRERLGWHEVDTAIGELRRHFRTATTPQDYKAVGLDCVTITEALSRQVYDHGKHTPEARRSPPKEGRRSGSSDTLMPSYAAPTTPR
jgi:hypothetical protein